MEHSCQLLMSVCQKLQFGGEVVSVFPFGDGHINDTYLVDTVKQGERCSYVLQRINQNVFKDPLAVMDNITRVSTYLTQKLSASANPNGFLHFIQSDNGRLYCELLGDVWRAYQFIPGVKPDPTQYLAGIKGAGEMIGNFHQMLCEFPANDLQETIPHFHHTQARYAAFSEVVSTNAYNRNTNAAREIEQVLAYANDVCVITDLLRDGAIPLRVTHNDTKLDNVLFDAAGKAICLIDFDTIMPGVIGYDFGDSIRSMATSAAEDEVDLSRVCFSLESFESFTAGYCLAAKSFMTQIEKETLAFCARLITLEQGIRFLTDYLNGDTYYKVNHLTHNLERARNQLKLVDEMYENSGKMEKIVSDHVK